VIIHNLDILGAAGGPTKANAELVIYANAVLPTPVAAKCLKAVTRRNPKIIQTICLVQLLKLSAGNCLDADKPPHPNAIEERFCVGALECLNHAR